MPMLELRVVLVDDSPTFRLILQRILQEVPEFAHLHVFSNATDMLSFVTHNTADLVLLDIDMPNIDGLQALRLLKDKFPSLPVIMVTATAEAHRAAQAMALGAVTVLNKPRRNISIAPFLAGLRGAFDIAPLPSAPRTEVSGALSQDSAVEDKPFFDLIVVGASTGGPQALSQIAPAFSRSLRTPILVVQHMPAGFTDSLAHWLNNVSDMHIAQARCGDLLQPSCVWIAPGSKHMKVVKNQDKYSIDIFDAPPVNECKPSLDVLLESLVSCYLGKVLVLILTGMGHDGRQGLSKMNREKTYCIVQEQSSCVVYGMGRCVVEAGLTDETKKLDEIKQFLSRLPYRKRSGVFGEL